MEEKKRRQRTVPCLLKVKEQAVLKDGVDEKWRRKKETENRPLSP